MFQNRWSWIFLLVVLADWALAFVQHYHLPLDGDLAPIVLPGEHYAQVLRDPFGFSAVFGGEKYAGAGRYFAHAFMSVYFKQAPAFFQQFTDPVNSVYLACAALKMAVQLLIGGTLAFLISRNTRPLWPGFVLALVLIAPLFQNTAYSGTMGIVQTSITYACFYSLPLGVLLLFFSIQFYARTGFFKNTALALLAVPLAFSGPLVAPVVLLASPFVFYHFLEKTAWPAAGWLTRARLALAKIPGPFWLLSLLCVWSLYLGTHNSENSAAVPLAERYARLPHGLFRMLTLRPGLPLLVLAVLANTFFLKKLAAGEAPRTLKILQWLAVFSILYIALLPLGGYREYRPEIVRGDTLLPVVLCLAFSFGVSAYCLLQNLPAPRRTAYALGCILLLAIFENADRLDTSLNRCERAALERIARAPEPVVRLEAGCTVMGWHTFSDYRQTEWNGRLLEIWRVTPERKLYFQE